MNNSASGASTPLHHHQLNPYRNDYHQIDHPKDISIAAFEKQDTPTLLITDSDNENLPNVNEVEEPDLFALSADRNMIKKLCAAKRYLPRKPLQNTKSEEEEQIFDEECLKYLTENERITLAYYRNEYETKSMTIDAFVALLLEMLDTNQKVYLSLIFACLSGLWIHNTVVLHYKSSESCYSARRCRQI